MDAAEEMNRQYEEHMRSLDDPRRKYDPRYSRVRLPRDFFIRLCRAMDVVAGITHKLHTLSLDNMDDGSWGKLEIEYKYLADMMQFDETKPVRLLIDYDPSKEKVLLIRCPANPHEKES